MERKKKRASGTAEGAKPAEGGFFARLESLRRGRGETLGDVARVCGISGPAVYGWRTGRMPSTDNLLLLARHYGTTVEWLLTGGGESGGGRVVSALLAANEALRVENITLRDALAVARPEAGAAAEVPARHIELRRAVARLLADWCAAVFSAADIRRIMAGLDPPVAAQPEELAEVLEGLRRDGLVTQRTNPVDGAVLWGAAERLARLRYYIGGVNYGGKA